MLICNVELFYPVSTSKNSSQRKFRLVEICNPLLNATKSRQILHTAPLKTESTTVNTVFFFTKGFNIYIIKG